MNIIDIGVWRLAAGYLLLAVPLGILLWLRLPLLGQTLTAVARMTLQLLFVGFYLQVIFDLNRLWLTGAWGLVMIGVANLSIARGCRLRPSKLAGGLFLALLGGTLVPLLFLVFVVLEGAAALDAQCFVPLCGMMTGVILAIHLTASNNFTAGGTLDKSLFQAESP